MKKESKLNKLFRENKTILMFTVLLLLLGIPVMAFTTITNEEIVTTSGTFANINTILYVEAGNGSDIQVTIDRCEDDACSINLPCGNYNLGLNITLKENMRFFGNGICSVINITADNTYILAETNSNNIVIENLKINVNNKSYTQDTGLVFFNDSNHNNTVIRNIYGENAQTSFIYIRGNNLKIKDNNLENVFNGIVIVSEFGSLRESVISGNYITNVNQTSSSESEYGEGIEVNTHNSTGYTRIFDNTVKGFRENGIDANALNVEIFGNYILMPEEYPLETTGITVNSLQVNASGTVYGNIIEGVNENSSGIIIGGGASATAEGVSVTGNKISGLGFGTGIYLRGALDSTAMGNILENLTNGFRFNTSSIDIDMTLIGNIFKSVTFDTNLEPDSMLRIDNNKILIQTETIFNTGTFEFVIKNNNAEILIVDTSTPTVNWTIRNQNGEFKIYETTNSNFPDFKILQGGSIKVGTGVSQQNITMTSPDGTEYDCSVANGGAFSCT